jgi:dTMP kinase
VLVAIDGIDGAGKTTLAEALAAKFRAFNPLIEKEPTSHSKWGIRLKESAITGRLPRDTELEYFHKDRMHHIEFVLRPALAEGRLVILDRYVDSTLAYQCSSPEDAEALYQKFAGEILIPDVTFILDCTPEVGLGRIGRSRNGNSTFEKQKTLADAARIYRSRQGRNYVHLDANKDKSSVLETALRELQTRFPQFRSVSERQQDAVRSEPKRRANLFCRLFRLAS